MTNEDRRASGRLDLPESEWRARLGDEEFRVLRREATERPFTSALNHEGRSGVFLCAGCGAELFRSDAKFDSGTGWPSFFEPIAGAVDTKRDFKLIVPRTEYHCTRCGGHQGHVFSDGPAPTGLRYCNNGVALRFRPAPARSVRRERGEAGSLADAAGELGAGAKQRARERFGGEGEPETRANPPGGEE